MISRDAQRIIILQKALKLAKDTLSKIEHGCRNPEGVAAEAHYEIMRIEHQDKPTPLQGLVGG